MADEFKVGDRVKQAAITSNGWPSIGVITQIRDCGVYIFPVLVRFILPNKRVIEVAFQSDELERAIIVDAGQQVADLQAENAELRKDIEHLRKIVKAATEYANAHFYAEPQWKINRLFEDMCSVMDTPEDKQS